MHDLWEHESALHVPIQHIVRGMAKAELANGLIAFANSVIMHVYHIQNYTTCVYRSINISGLLHFDLPESSQTAKCLMPCEYFPLRKGYIL